MRVSLGRRLGIVAAIVFMLFALLGYGQDKVTLVVKADEGREARYSTTMTIELEVAGQKLSIESTQVQKVKFTKVAPNGEITMERTVESREVKMMGQTMPDEDKQDEADTVTVRPNGTLVSYKAAKDDADEAKFAVRLFAAGNPVFPDKPVGVGDKWTHEFKADASTGQEAATADFEVLGFETVQGVETVKIKMVYRETSTSPPITATNTFWIEKSSGDAVAADFEAQNIRFGEETEGALATVKGRTERTSGSPLAVDEGKTTSEPKKEKNIDETVKDYEKLDGLFPLYRKREAGRTTLYMEIREDQLDKLVMLQATASTGTSEQVVAGDPINDLIFKFVRMDEDRIVLLTPNIAFRADESSPIAKAVKRSFADAYLEAYKIEAKQADRKSVLINVSDLFRGDIAGISQLFSGGGLSIPGLGGGGAGYSMDRDKTYIVTLKNFPDNLYVETMYHFTRSGSGGGGLASLLSSSTLADPRSIPFKVNYNLFMLPDSGYVPRLFDPRVGYFYTSYQDFTKDRKLDQQVNLIYRWRLEKQDPTAPVSPPKKPIEFWLDNAIPLEYRDAVRDGILSWNRAFEKAGFKDVIVVHQMPDDADRDHADMRYNTIRWVASPDAGYAVALFRVNPITGEILNANITVDANMTRFMNVERERIVEPANYFEEAHGDPLDAKGPFRCSMGRQMMRQAYFGLMALNMLSMFNPAVDEQEYIKGVIRSTVCHEMGHVLGLRHNFAGSTELTLEQLRDPDLVSRYGTSASIMDYIPFNISALKQPKTAYWHWWPGTYDEWAIVYGYTDFGAKTPEDEKPQLQRIASQCNAPGHAYHSDEAADNIDPRVGRFDLGKEPLDYFARMMQVSRYMLFNLDKRSPKKGESFYEFTRDFSFLLGTYAQAAAGASRYIGGLSRNNNFRGDPGERPTIAPVPGALQKRALELLNTYVFAENAFAFPKHYYSRFAPNPNADLVDSFLSGPDDYPVRDRFANIQSSALRRIFSTNTLRRIANTEFKVGGSSDVLTMATLFQSVSARVWSELGSGTEITPLRRQLQRAHLDIMLDLFLDSGGTAPPDARLLAGHHLRLLRNRIAAAEKTAKGEYAPIHLAECRMRIDRALNAQQVIGLPAPARTPSLLEQLLGGGGSDRR